MKGRYPKSYDTKYPIKIIKHIKQYWWKQKLYRYFYLLKIKSYCVMFKVVTAYDPKDYEQFSFCGWVSLIIKNKPIYFKRWRDPSIEWHIFSWETIFKKYWKYTGIKKDKYKNGFWYYMTWDFKNHKIIVKEILRKPLTKEDREELNRILEICKL